jgi:hypothetical protein
MDSSRLFWGSGAGGGARRIDCGLGAVQVDLGRPYCLQTWLPYGGASAGAAGMWSVVVACCGWEGETVSTGLQPGPRNKCGW